MTTSLVLDYPIPGHEDRLRVPRMNDIGYAYLASRKSDAAPWDFPVGTIIAKEVYASKAPRPGEESVMLTAMVKAPSDPRAKGGWLWVVKDLVGGKESVFPTTYCLTCHANANEKHPYADKNPKGEFRDYVFVRPGFVPAAPSSPDAPD